MSKKYNATCAICGKPYKMCRSCSDEWKFKPWRAVTDTIDHYKIYLALNGYTLTGDRDMARSELQVCNLDGKENFVPEIAQAINDILAEGRKDNKFNQKPKKNFGNLKHVVENAVKADKDTTENEVISDEITTDK